MNLFRFAKMQLTFGLLREFSWLRIRPQCQRPQFDSLVRKFPWKRDWLPTPAFLGFLGGSGSKKSACNVGDLSSIPGLGRSPRGGHGNPLQYSCLESPHGQRSLVGHSPWGRKELDTTERLSTVQPQLTFLHLTYKSLLKEFVKYFKTFFITDKFCCYQF